MVALASRVTKVGPGGWDETGSSYRHRLHDPADFQDGSLRTVAFSDSKPKISAVVGKRKGATVMTVQTVIFPKGDWTLDRAKKWISQHPDVGKITKADGAAGMTKRRIDASLASALEDVDWEEVSGVEAPANKTPGWGVIKGDRGPSTALAERIEEILKEDDESAEWGETLYEALQSASLSDAPRGIQQAATGLSAWLGELGYGYETKADDGSMPTPRPKKRGGASPFSKAGDDADDEKAAMSALAGLDVSDAPPAVKRAYGMLMGWLKNPTEMPAGGNPNMGKSEGPMPRGMRLMLEAVGRMLGKSEEGDFEDRVAEAVDEHYSEFLAQAIEIGKAEGGAELKAAALDGARQKMTLALKEALSEL